MSLFKTPLISLQSGTQAQGELIPYSKDSISQHGVDPALQRDERRWLKGLVFVLLACMILLMSACKQSPDTTTHPATTSYTHTIYLVRHAEKQKGENPDLTDAGRIRALTLSDMLVDKGITHIHSSNYVRTLQTAMPLANVLDIDVEVYNARDLEGFAKALRTVPGIHLVVGHSNTTPDLAALLSGEEIKLMPETEYDRFTVVKLGADGQAVTEISQFGRSLDD